MQNSRVFVSFFGLTFKEEVANYLKRVFIRLLVPRDQHKKGLFSNLACSRLLLSSTLSTPSVGGGVRGGVGGGGGVLPSCTLNMNNFETSVGWCSLTLMLPWQPIFDRQFIREWKFISTTKEVTFLL